jgi:hypothetical protein
MFKKKRDTFHVPDPDKLLVSKDEVIDLIERYLSDEGNSLANLSDLIPILCPPTHRNTNFIRDIGYKMERSGSYILMEEANENGQVQYLIKPLPKKTWWDRNPGWDKVRTGVITAAFSLLVGWLLYLNQRQDKDRLDNTQNQRLHVQDSLINNLQNALADSIASIKADTSR